jgi:hypothetical protein
MHFEDAKKMMRNQKTAANKQLKKMSTTMVSLHTHCIIAALMKISTMMVSLMATDTDR